MSIVSVPCVGMSSWRREIVFSLFLPFWILKRKRNYNKPIVPSCSKCSTTLGNIFSTQTENKTPPRQDHTDKNFVFRKPVDGGVGLDRNSLRYPFTFRTCLPM